MGIQVEFNPDLALRNYAKYKSGERKEEECVPEALQAGKEYAFLKRGERNYWLHGEIPLLQTEGEGKLSMPLASVVILEATHVLDGEEIWTHGTYKVIEVFDDQIPHFNGFAKIK